MSGNDDTAAEAPKNVKSSASIVYEYSRAIVGVALVVLLGWTFLHASLEHGIIVEAVPVPESVKTMGFDSQIVASRIADRMAYLAALGLRAEKYGDIVAQPPDVPVKVELSGVGISIDEAYSYLRSLLGSSRNVSGEIVTQGMKVVLRLRVDGENTLCENHDDPDQVDRLIVRATDCIYAHAQTDRFARYLTLRYRRVPGDDIGNGPRNTQRLADRPLAERVYAAGAGDSTISAEDRAWAYEGWGMRLVSEGDDAATDGGLAGGADSQKFRDPVHLGRSSVGLLHIAAVDYSIAADKFTRSVSTYYTPLAAPHLVDATISEQEYARQSGDEHLDFSALENLTQRLELWRSANFPSRYDQVRLPLYYRASLAVLAGDYARARQLWSMTADVSRDGADSRKDKSYAEEQAWIAAAQMHDGAAAKGVEEKGGHLAVPVLLWLDKLNPSNVGCDDASLDAQSCFFNGEPNAAFAFVIAECGSGERSGGSVRMLFLRDCLSNGIFAGANDFAAKACAMQLRTDAPDSLLPRDATCLARAYVAFADREIGQTSTDCDSCLRLRGRIDAMSGNWDCADYWLERAVNRSPDLPRGYYDWARVLLQEAAVARSARERAVIFEKVLHVLANGLKHGPRDGDLYEALGEAWLAQGRPENALPALRMAVSLAPDWTRAGNECRVAAKLDSSRWFPFGEDSICAARA